MNKPALVKHFRLVDHMNVMNDMTVVDRNVKFDLFADHLCSARLGLGSAGIKDSMYYFG